MSSDIHPWALRRDDICRYADVFLTFVIKFNTLTISGQRDFTFIKPSCDVGFLFT